MFLLGGEVGNEFGHHSCAVTAKRELPELIFLLIFQGEVNNSSVPGRSARQASPFGSAQITRVPFGIRPAAGLVAVPGLL